MTAPDTTAGDGLRSAIADGIQDRIGHARYYCEELADAVLPALRDLLAAAAKNAEKVRRVEALFAGGPFTACRTTWRREPGWSLPGSTAPLTECVEVPMDELRQALDGAP